MRGHIRKRGDTFSIVLDLGRDPATGKRKQQWLSVKGTKKEAEKKLNEMLHQLDTGTFMKPGKTTLAEYLNRWLKEYAWPNLAPRTAEGYQHIIQRHVIPALGSIPLTQLKPEHLQRYYSDKLANGRCDGKGVLSPRTVRHHHMALHNALKHAEQWGLLTRNVADAVSPPRCQRPEWHTMNEDNIADLLEAAKSTIYYDLFYLAIYTGMRRSELLALRWCDVDLILCQAYVSRTLHHLRDGSMVFRPPKTGKGSRNVALTPSTALLLNERRDNQITNLAILGTKLEEDDLIFTNLEGKPFLPNTVTHAWIKLTRRAGLRGVRLHDARHTHASLLLKQGTHPKIVQERLGHSSIQITLDTYSHVTPGMQEAAAAGFDQLMAVRRENRTANNG